MRPGVTYTYDNNGNTLTKTDASGTTTYAWDFENRLSTITLPGNGGTISFAYDPFGRRIKKVPTTATSIYAYDGDNLIEETNASGAVVARYVQTLNIDEPLAMLRSGATNYYSADGLGSITSLTSSAGAVANTYIYDSFGNLTASTGTIVNPFRYTAREFDSESGLYFYRARYYDPAVGRFLSEDRTKEVIKGMNFYAYVRNNAPNFVDPDGRGPWDWLKKIIDGLKFGHETKEKIEDPIDWAFCGLYYERCLTTALGIKADLAQALNSPDHVVSSAALIALQQQLGANSMSQLNLNACLKSNENCRKALECAKKGLTNPLPFPSSNVLTDLINTLKDLLGEGEKR